MWLAMWLVVKLHMVLFCTVDFVRQLVVARIKLC